MLNYQRVIPQTWMTWMTGFRWKTGQADGVEKHGAWNDDHETAKVGWSLYIVYI